jgi:hypothetical protein
MPNKYTLAAVLCGLASIGAAVHAGAQTREPLVKPAISALPAKPLQIEGTLLGGTYTFTLNSFRITDTRSLHNDTDFVAFAVAVGSNPPITLPTKAMGDVNNGTHQVNLTIPNVLVQPGQKVAFTYRIDNTGFNANKVEQALKTAVAAGAAKAAMAGGAGLGSLVGCPECGAFIGPGLGWLAGKLEGIIFANCDGTVAAGAHTFPQADLARLTAGGKVISQIDDNKGTDSATGCGSNSRYYVTWSVSGTAAPPPVASTGGAGGGGAPPNGRPPLHEK